MGHVPNYANLNDNGKITKYANQQNITKKIPKIQTSDYN